jgi:hypothetical protein
MNPTTNPLDPTLRNLNSCDCCTGTQAQTPAAIANRPGLSSITFRAGTHGQFKASLLAALTDKDLPALAGLRTRDDEDFTIALLDGFSAMAEVLTFYSERIANEAWLRTAVQRRSVLELARGIGYELKPGVAAETWAAFTVEDATGAPGWADVKSGTKLQSIPGPGEDPQTYETVADFEARKEWNVWPALALHRVLPALGDNELRLAGTTTQLNPGDALLLIGEERENDTGSERWEFRLARAVTTVAAAGPLPAHTVVTLDRPLGYKRGARQVRPPSLEPVRVFALRRRASVFGYNAPDWRSLPDSTRQSYRAAAGLDPNQTDTEWPNFTIFSPQQLVKVEVAQTIQATAAEVAAATHAEGAATGAQWRAKTMHIGGQAIGGAVKTASDAVSLAMRMRDDVERVAQTVGDSILSGAKRMIESRIQAVTSPATTAAIQSALGPLRAGIDSLGPQIQSVLATFTNATAATDEIIQQLKAKIDDVMQPPATVSPETYFRANDIATKSKELVDGASGDIGKRVRQAIAGIISGDPTAAIIDAAKRPLTEGAFTDTAKSIFTNALAQAKDQVGDAAALISLPGDLTNLAGEVAQRSIDIAKSALNLSTLGAGAVESIRLFAETAVRAAQTQMRDDVQSASNSIRDAALTAARAVAMDAGLLRGLLDTAETAGASARAMAETLFGAIAVEFVQLVVALTVDAVSAADAAAKRPRTAASMAEIVQQTAEIAKQTVPWIIRGTAMAGGVTAAGLALGPLAGLAVVGAVVEAPALLALAGTMALLATGPAAALLATTGLAVESVVINHAAAGAEDARKRIHETAERAKRDRQGSVEKYQLLAAADTIDLDHVYAKLMTGDWVVLADGDYGEVFRIMALEEAARADFLLTGKTTRLKLAGEWENITSSHVREITVFCEPTELPLAPALREDSVGGSMIEVAAAVTDLPAERLLLIRGTDADTGMPAVETMRWVRSEIIPDGTRLFLRDPLKLRYRRETAFVHGNVARVTHGETVAAEVMGSGNAGSEHQQFALKQKPLTYTQSADGSASSLSVYVNGVQWQEAPSLYGLGPSERAFVVRLDDDGTARVIMGDGWFGARLPTGPENLVAHYRKGSGLDGLVNAGQLTQLLNRPLGIRSATNPAASSGAADPETMAEARTNAPLQTLTLDRVVSLTDFADYSRAFPGVAKAHAAWVWTQRGRGVLVHVVGPDEAEFTAADALPDNLKAALLSHGDPLTPVSVRSGKVARFVLAGTVTADSDRLAADVKVALDAALTAAFSYDERDFGQAVALSEVLQVIHSVPGVQHADLTAFHLSGASGIGPVVTATAPQPGDGLEAAPVAEVPVIEAASLTNLTVILAS